MGGFSTATAAGGLFGPAVYMPVADRPNDEVIHIYIQFHCTMMTTRALVSLSQAERLGHTRFLRTYLLVPDTGLSTYFRNSQISVRSIRDPDKKIMGFDRASSMTPRLTKMWANSAARCGCYRSQGSFHDRQVCWQGGTGPLSRLAIDGHIILLEPRAEGP